MSLLNHNNKYYSLKNILSKNAHYNIIIGERSNGKTYASLKYGVEKSYKNNRQMAYIRRWDEDLKGKRGATIFDALSANGEIAKITENKWTYIYYWSHRWYFAKDDENGKRIISEKPFCYGFSITAMEHDKSTSFPEVDIIIFDEFTSRESYLPDEFVKFMNVLSTIIRDRDNVQIFMLGNTVNKYCPYFNEMGLKHIKEMDKGQIDIYSYGESDLKVAVEFSDNPNKNKASNVYFAFDNPKLQTITGKGGVWEIDIYPHAPCKWLPKDILFTFFIIFDNELLQCEIIEKNSNRFIFIHAKTTEIKNPDKDLIYDTEYHVGLNYRRRITSPTLPIEKKIADLFRQEKIFYQDNDTGEIVRNYLNWCKH